MHQTLSDDKLHLSRRKDASVPLWVWVSKDQSYLCDTQTGDWRQNNCGDEGTVDALFVHSLTEFHKVGSITAFLMSEAKLNRNKRKAITAAINKNLCLSPAGILICIT